jgi:hypothetical protein
MNQLIIPSSTDPCPFCGKNPKEWIGIFYKELARLDKEEKSAYKRKYMARNKDKNNDFRPVSKEEFEEALKVLLNSPPRKRTKQARQKSV